MGTQLEETPQPQDPHLYYCKECHFYPLKFGERVAILNNNLLEDENEGQEQGEGEGEMDTERAKAGDETIRGRVERGENKRGGMQGEDKREGEKEKKNARRRRRNESSCTEKTKVQIMSLSERR